MTKVATIAAMHGWILPGCTCTKVRDVKLRGDKLPRAAAWNFDPSCVHHGGAS